MRTNVILMEIGKDFDIKIRGYTNKPQYKVVKKLILDQSKTRINLKKVKEKYTALQERYPDKGYYLVRDVVHFRLFSDPKERKHKRVMWILGRKEEGRRGIPIYVSTTLRKLYVPKSFVETKYRLTCSVVSYRLRDIGIPYRMAYAK
jgi:hypothetical protein